MPAFAAGGGRVPAWDKAATAHEGRHGPFSMEYWSQRRGAGA